MDVIRRLLVVVLLSGVALQAQVVQPATTTGSLAALGSVTLNVSGYASIAFQLTGTFAATVTFEGSVDGVIYQTINVTPTNSTTAVTSTTATGVWVASVGGLKYVRARVSAYTSGSVVATLQTALAGGGSGGGGGGGSSPSGTIGAAVPATASPVAVKDNAGNLAYPLVDGSGNLLVAVTGAGSGGTSSVDGAAYVAGTTAGTPAMLARDDASITQLAEDKVGIPRGTAFRAMHVNFRNASGTEIGVAGNAIIVDGSAVTQPVSGTVTAAQATAANLNATVTQGPAAVATAGWPMTNGSGSQATATWTSATALDSTVTLATMNNFGTAVVTIRTTSTITQGTVTFEASDDGSNYYTVMATRTTSAKSEGTYTLVATTSQSWTAYTGAWVRFRVRLSTVITGTGSAVVLMTPNAAAAAAGSVVTQGTAADLNATVTGSGAAGAAATGVVTVQGIAGMTKVLVTPDSVALPANQSVNVAQVNGVTTLTGTGATGTGAQRVTVAVDSATVAGSASLPTGSNVIGHVIADTGSTTAVTGNVTAVQATGSNLHIVCDSGCSSSAGFADNAAFTYGTTSINPIGGVLDDVATNTATENSAAVARITPQKGLHINLRNQAGTEIGTSTTPVQVTLANTGANATAVKVDGSAVTQPVSGTVTTTPPSNASTNVAQLAGTTTDTNSGTKSAGTLRVVLATDQPALTNKLLVTPDSVALPANQSVNVSQMNGVTVTMGAGATGTGVQRVNPVSASATGAAPPASAEYTGGLGSGATGGFLTGITVCDLSKPITITSATTTLMITGVSGRQVRICSMHMVTAIANNVALIEGTGATCGTGTAGLAGGTTAANGYNFAANGGLSIGSGLGEVITTATTGDSVCIITSAAGPLAGFIKYTIF